ncbi:DNA mismatch repair protein Mlh3 [Bombina bombina]|uniref:DNA mismatch repair protein Mlh3 n=1 Tax=Bombina bombina TaxID=8345 RepID=UPI00235A4BBD|nr:DNA mismatch repair protein Mlh3 [Bombina bombina]
MIRILTEEVRCSLRSGFTISSVGQCVEELLLNSTDAEATCIAVRVDLETLRIQVVDNGYGLCEEDMKLVGMRYFTSKCHSLKDLEDLKFYGFRGEAIASIAEMCSVVEISSKKKNAARTFTKLFQNGKSQHVHEAELNRPCYGTTVTVFNLFYSLPVRRKCMDHVIEIERIRQRVEAVSLIHPSISFSLKNDASFSVILQLPKTKDVCSRFCQIYGLAKSQKLLEIQHSFNGFSIQGYISSESHYNKSIQFLYINKRLVLKTKLHKLINFLLRKESVICRSKPHVGGKLSSSPGKNRGPELYGVFVINLLCNLYEYDICFEPAKTLIEFRDWNSVLLCVEEGVKTFLQRTNMFLEPSKEDITDFNEKTNLTLSCHEFQNVEKNQQEIFQKACDSVTENYAMSNLKSKYVIRSNTNEIQMPNPTVNDPNDTNKFQNTPCRVSDALVECKTTQSDMLEVSPHNSSIPKTNTEDTGSSTCVNKDNSEDMVCPGSFEGHCSVVMHDSAELEAVQSGNSSDHLKRKCSTLLSPRFMTWETSLPVDTVRDKTLSNILCPVVNEVISQVTHDTNKNYFWSKDISNESTKFEVSQTVSKLPSPEGTNKQFKMFCRPGPVCSLEILENNISGKSNQSGNLSKLFPNNRKSVDAKFPTLNTRNMDVLTHTYTPGIKHRDTKQTSKSRASRTLHLFGQLGSLERFKRQYGKTQSLAAHSSSLDKVHNGNLKIHPPSEKTETNAHPAREPQELADTILTNVKQIHFNLSQQSHSTQSEHANQMLNPSSNQSNGNSLASKLCQMRNTLESSYLEDINTEALRNLRATSEISLGIAIPSTEQISAVVKSVNASSPHGKSEEQTDCVQHTLTTVHDWETQESKITSDALDTFVRGSENYLDPNSTLQASGFASQNWCQCYEESLGRNVFINKATGLSSYSAPLEEGTTRCINDLSTTAVNVVCGNDNENSERDLLQSMYSKWENPVFSRHPMVAVDVSRGNADILAVKIHNILHPYRFTKDMIQTMKVLQQVDNKFIACLMKTEMDDGTESEGNLLVLVDQHAAHERIRLEQLIADSYEHAPGTSGVKRLKTSIVNPPLELDLTENQWRLLRAYAGGLRNIGLSLSFPDSHNTRVLVGEVPLCFVEKEANETHRGRSTVAKMMVQDYLREQVELLQVSGGAHGTFPLTVLRVLASQACHGYHYEDGSKLAKTDLFICTFLISGEEEKSIHL